MPYPDEHKRIAYIMTRFPKLTETFVLHELLALQKSGVRTEVFPLLRGRESITHPEARRLCHTVHFHAVVSLRLVSRQWHFLARKPHVYLRTLVEVMRGTLASPKFFLAALLLFPKAVLFAYEMERLKVRHIHAHFATNPTLAALIIHRLTGIPYSFTAHGSDLHVDRTMLDEKLRSAAFAVAISSYNKAVMVNTCGRDTCRKIHVVPCGVDVDRIRPRADWSITGPLQILCVASLEAVKGHRFLIEACAMLAQRGIDFHCHLVGDGRLRSAIAQRIVDLNLISRCHFHGGLPHNDVIEWLGKANVFALASVPTKQGKREGIPVALMEAMAAALPVVASDLSGIPELIEQSVSGILVQPGNSFGLADALQTCYENPILRQTMGCSARRTVVQRFNLERNTRLLSERFDRSA